MQNEFRALLGVRKLIDKRGETVRNETQPGLMQFADELSQWGSG